MYSSIVNFSGHEIKIVVVVVVEHVVFHAISSDRMTFPFFTSDSILPIN